MIRRLISLWLRIMESGGFLIDAPRLKYLNIEDERKPIKTITNSCSLNKVILLGDFLLQGCSDQFHKIFTSFSGVRDLNLFIGPSMFFMKMVPFPQFCNLSHFEATLPFYVLDRLLMFLPSCPNLRSLILSLIDSWARTNETLICEAVFVVFARVCRDRMRI